MPRRIRIQFQGQTVEADELEYEPLGEPWSEYKCADGAIVRLRTVVSRIVRLVDKKNDEGDPIYVTRSSNVLAVSPPSSDKSLM